MSRSRRLAAVAVLFAVGLGISACTSSDAGTTGYLNGAGSGYISSDGTVVEIAAADRGKPVEFAGTVEDGTEVTAESLRGKVVVLNLWYAGCGPCRLEAPFLEQVWQDNKDNPVAFLGVNTLDSVDTASSFAETYGITYPSILDAHDGSVRVALARVTPIQATPTTIVLDAQGRVAARVIGAFTDPSILATLVRDAVAENS